jgi:hypothetical protein
MTMRTTIRTARVSLFALAVCGALGFGASTVFASPPPICPELAVSRCRSLSDCQSTCASIGRDPASGRCVQNATGAQCCFCSF